MLDESDSPFPEHKRELSFYVTLLLVLPVYLTTPAAWVFVFLEFWQRGQTLCGLDLAPTREKLLFSLAITEVAFSIYHYHLVRKLASLPARFAPPHVDHLNILLLRILQSGLTDSAPPGSNSLNSSSESANVASMEENRPRANSPSELITFLDQDDHRAIDFRMRMRTWFHQVPFSRITKSSVRSWLSWSVYSVPFENLNQEEKEVIDHKVVLFEMRAGRKIAEDKPGEKIVQPMRLTLDPMNIRSRPFLAYAFISFAQLALSETYRRRFGVTFGVYRGIEYALRLPNVPNPANPILLLHGLGIGLPQYSQLLSNFLSNATLSSHPILIPLQPHISQSIWHSKHLTPLDREKMVEDMKGLLLHVGFVQENDKEKKNELTVLSHSNGSVVHAWILRAFPHLIHRSCFVDPVAFCLWEGDVCYNFVYKPPTNGMELLMRYFVGTELGIANMIQRHFDWSANILFFQEIPNGLDPNKTAFWLGGKDSIVNAERVRQYLLSHGVRAGLHFDPNGTHGSALISRGTETAGIHKIVRWLNNTGANTKPHI